MKKFKAVISLSLVAIMLLALVGCQKSTQPNGTATEKVTPIHLKMNHTVSETSSWHIYSLRFSELVKERTNGRYIIDVFPNEQLAAGSQQKSLEMLRSGSIDLDIHSTTIWAGIDPSFSIVLMPWILPTFEDVDKFLTGETGKTFLNLVTKNGAVPIALGENGYRQVLNTKHPIKSPADMKDLKIRVPGLTMYVDLYRQLGADATNLNWGEVFTSIQQKTIEGMESPPEIIYTGKFFEVNKYMTMWNASYDPIILSMSKKLYESLSPDDQKIFMECGQQAMQEQAKYQRETNETDAKLIDEKIELYYPTAAEIDAFKAASKPIYEKYNSVFSEELKSAFGYTK